MFSERVSCLTGPPSSNWSRRLENSLHQQPLARFPRISYFARMKIAEQMKRNGEAGETLQLTESLRSMLTGRFVRFYSTLLPSRIPCKFHKPKDRGAVYSTPNREVSKRAECDPQFVMEKASDRG